MTSETPKPHHSAETWIAKLNPAIPRSWLQLLAGLAWSGVGIMLGRWAYSWLQLYSLASAAAAALAAVVLAFLINLFFSVMARRNVDRIAGLPPKACVFAFQQWYSYPLVLFMVTLGSFMRRSELPRILLAVVYLGIGGGLLLASRHYYLHLVDRFSRSRR
jgi:hypothetical protein